MRRYPVSVVSNQRARRGSAGKVFFFSFSGSFESDLRRIGFLSF